MAPAVFQNTSSVGTRAPIVLHVQVSMLVPWADLFSLVLGPLNSLLFTVTDPKGPNQSLRDVKIHVWKWSWALTSRLGAVLGR